MRYALFTADIPDTDVWRNYMNRVEPKLRQAKGVSKLGENVWLLDLSQSTVALATLVAHADAVGIVHRILPFEHEPQWLPAGSDPSTT
jgi:hypothetical protein